MVAQYGFSDVLELQGKLANTNMDLILPCLKKKVLVPTACGLLNMEEKPTEVKQSHHVHICSSCA